jgi:hypothetical protein
MFQVKFGIIYITIFIGMTAFMCTGLGQGETLEAQASN